MSIEIGQVIIVCDRCTEQLVHDPSPDPISSFTSAPRWSSKDAVAFATKAGWSFDYEDGIIWVICPSCASEMAAVKFNRKEREGKIVVVGTNKKSEWEGFGSFLTDTPDEERYAKNRERSVKFNCQEQKGKIAVTDADKKSVQDMDDYYPGMSTAIQIIRDQRKEGS